MTSFLIKTFVKNYKETDNPTVRSAYGFVSSVAGIVCNVLLFALKLAAGFVIGSVSVIADAVNNLSDASSSVISLVGFKLSARPADEGHPCGHGRYEYIAGLIVSMTIIVIGAGLLRESIVKIINPAEVEFGAVTFAILVFSILVKLWMSLFFKKTGNLISSETLLAASADSRNDVISTLVVLIGAVVVRFYGIRLDGWLGVLVALFVIACGIKSVKDTIDPVLGRAPDAETVRNIRGRILSYEGVLGAHDLMVHDYGAGHRFASVHVEMSADGDALENHEVIDRIERDFLENDGIHMIVHFDPVPSKNSELGGLREWITAELRKLDSRISIHDLRLEDESVSLDCVVPQAMNIGDAEIKGYVENIVGIRYPAHTVEVNIDRGFTEIVN